MKPSLQFLQDRFSLFNSKIFGGRLPAVPISLCEATSFLGQHKSKLRTLSDGRREHFEHQLRFSVSFDLPERELEDVLIHEMIHYFIAYNGLQDRSNHGPLFKAMMNSINEAHARNIRVSHRLSHAQIADASVSRKRWHVIAVLHFVSGETGVKVLPRVIPKILDYYSRTMSASNIKGVELYLHYDPFFNQYPSSFGQRCHLISPVELQTHLSGAHRLKVSGRQLIQC